MKKTEVENINERLGKTIEIVENSTVWLYLVLHKRTRKLQTKRVIYKAELEDDAADFFRENILRAINFVMKSERKIETFWNGLSDSPDTTLYLDYETIQQLPLLNYVLEKINSEEDVPPVRKLDEKITKNLKSFAVVFKKDENNIVIYFRRFKPTKIIKSSFPALIFRNGTFDILRSDVFQLDSYVDSIYYETKDGIRDMYVLNLSEFEYIFEFKERYFNGAKQAIEKMKNIGLIEISDSVLNKVESGVRYSKRLTAILKNKKIEDLTIAHFDLYLKKSKNVLRYKIEDGKVVIDSEDALKDFLDVCEKKIVQDVEEENVLYRVPKKELIKG